LRGGSTERGIGGGATTQRCDVRVMRMSRWHFAAPPYGYHPTGRRRVRQGPAPKGGSGSRVPGCSAHWRSLRAVSVPRACPVLFPRTREHSTVRRLRRRSAASPRRCRPAAASQLSARQPALPPMSGAGPPALSRLLLQRLPPPPGDGHLALDRSRPTSKGRRAVGSLDVRGVSRHARTRRLLPVLARREDPPFASVAAPAQ
jgi:hypothetical protein